MLVCTGTFTKLLEQQRAQLKLCLTFCDDKFSSSCLLPIVRRSIEFNNHYRKSHNANSINIGPFSTKRFRTNLSCLLHKLNCIHFLRANDDCIQYEYALQYRWMNWLIPGCQNEKFYRTLNYIFCDASRQHINDVWINDRVNMEQMKWIYHYFFYCRSHICHSIQLQKKHMWTVFVSFMLVRTPCNCIHFTIE